MNLKSNECLWNSLCRQIEQSYNKLLLQKGLMTNCYSETTCVMYTFTRQFVSIHARLSDQFQKPFFDSLGSPQARVGHLLSPLLQIYQPCKKVMEHQSLDYLCMTFQRVFFISELGTSCHGPSSVHLCCHSRTATPEKQQFKSIRMTISLSLFDLWFRFCLSVPSQPLFEVGQWHLLLTVQQRPTKIGVLISGDLSPSNL